MTAEPQMINARIGSTQLGIGDHHDEFTFWLTLDLCDGEAQAFGGRANTQIGLLRAVLETVGVKSWESLKGQIIRVVADRTQVFAIGHVLQDRWVEPTDTGWETGPIADMPCWAV